MNIQSPVLLVAGLLSCAALNAQKVVGAPAMPGINKTAEATDALLKKQWQQQSLRAGHVEMISLADASTTPVSRVVSRNDSRNKQQVIARQRLSMK